MRKPRLPLRLIVPAGLVALVALLATLQYRWVGQVSEAERAQKQKSLHDRAESFSEEFDRELSRLYSAFQSDGAELTAGNVETYARHLEAWRERARFPDMLRALYLVDTESPDQIKEFRPADKTLVAVQWPADLVEVRKNLVSSSVSVRLPTDPPRRTSYVNETMLPSVPAMRIMLPAVVSTTPMSGSGFGAASLMSFGLNSRFLVAHLNREYLQSTVLPTLAAQYFPDRDGDSYRFAVIDAKAPASPVFSRNVAQGATLDPAHADASAPLFSLRLDLVTFARSINSVSAGGGARGASGTLAAGAASATLTMQGLKIDSHPTTTVPAPPPHINSNNSFQMVIQARGTPPEDFLTVTPRVVATGWQVVLQHTAGSLDAAVSQIRRRNLLLSFGILAVLMVSVGFVLISAQRAERLAGQQMDFVATVSHELRTPLAVIRSAAQNMSAGVVHDAGQAKRYGDLIETEGRRLTDMVEQVLEYAGISANRRAARTHPVDAGAIVRDVAAASSDLLASEHFSMTLAIADNLPSAAGDEDALRRALQNLIANAVKYGADGRTVTLTVARGHTRGRDEVQVSVGDRGRGIDPEDVAHIFEPFYRGRYAIDRQIRGNGLGLSLVKRIAEAHGGHVSVTSTPGEGATFTLHLPALHDVATRTIPTLVSEPMSQK